MKDVLICQICGKSVDNNLPTLHEHISQHISNYKEEARHENQDIDVCVLSYFDGLIHINTTEKTLDELSHHTGNSISICTNSEYGISVMFESGASLEVEFDEETGQYMLYVYRNNGCRDIETCIDQ